MVHLMIPKVNSKKKSVVMEYINSNLKQMKLLQEKLKKLYSYIGLMVVPKLRIRWSIHQLNRVFKKNYKDLMHKLKLKTKTPLILMILKQNSNEKNCDSK